MYVRGIPPLVVSYYYTLETFSCTLLNLEQGEARPHIYGASGMDG